MRSDKNVHDIVTHLEWLSTLKDQSHYRLTLSSRLALLRYTRQCAVYQNQSVPEVVEQVLRSEPSCLFDGAAESVWDVRTWHRVVTGTVATRDYNYRTATTPMDAAVSVRNDAVTTGEHYRCAAPYREAGDDASPEPETESGAFYARLHHERELNRSVRIHLFSNAAHLTPGQVLEPQGDVITALQEGVILTLVNFRGARDSRLHVSVWGLPYTERYCFRPVEIPRPVIPGTLPARIESREKNDTYAHWTCRGAIG